ncbi:putative MFS monosaccharide transporter [Aspergillus taichungensis]|uniref:Putative MFS monosaccharide transporter n=1 Tax=Aspergillus taichungensis TaxID=482145 RepID=A0A2J5I0C5_9EURO|nr:putative MFS monosaccharide transporter [Aspergillus taichungensis]
MPFLLKKPEDAVGSATPAITIGLFAAFGGLLFGYDTGTISGILAMKYWRELFSTGYINPKDNFPDVTSSQSSMIVSLLSAGTFFGALTAAPVADHFGRRWGMIIDSVVFSFGVVLQTVATSIPLFVAGRFFAGYGVGLLSATIPLYQSETAPKWIRGTIVGAYQLAITIGLLIAAIVNNGTKDRMDTGSYRIPVALQFAWAIILVAGMLILPETPRFLIKKDKHEMAAKSLARLRRMDVNESAVVEELAEIQANHEYELSLGQASFMEIFRGTLGKRLATGCSVQALQQLAGCNFIFYYGTHFFQASGIQNAFTVQLITNIVNVCSTLPGLYMVERWGRRPLLLYGAAGMCVSQLIVAIVGTATSSDVANKVLIAFVCVYIFFFASSWGPCGWVVTGELFPLKARARCLSITTATNWLLNWAIAYSTPYLVDAGPGNANLQSKVFFIWGGFCFLAVIFVYTSIYETKGLSLEEVDELYATVTSAWNSPGFKPSSNFAGALDHQAKLDTLEEEDSQVKSDMEHTEKA